MVIPLHHSTHDTQASCIIAFITGIPIFHFSPPSTTPLFTSSAIHSSYHKDLITHPGLICQKPSYGWGLIRRGRIQRGGLLNVMVLRSAEHNILYYFAPSKCCFMKISLI